MNTQELFGQQVHFDQVASCRINRLRVRVGGIQTAVARVALGGQRTQIWLTLTDGRTLSAVARDDPNRADALEHFRDELERDRANRWLAAFARGEPVVAGKVTLTRDLMQVGRKQLAWRDVGGWSMREGGFMIDGPNHRMVFSLWIASTPWAGAMANVLEAMAPGKNYERWPPTSLPRVGFTATSALTHVPGALTMRARGYVLLALIAIPLLGLAGYALWMQRESDRLNAYYTRSAREQAKELVPKLADPAFAEIAPCKPTEYGRYTTYLIGVQGGGNQAKLSRGKTPVSELDTYPSELLVWDVVDGKVRGVLSSDRTSAGGTTLCSATVRGTAIEPLLEQLERKATKAELDAVNADASRPHAAPSAIDDETAKLAEPTESAGSNATGPAQPPSDSKPRSTKVSTKSSISKPGLSPAAIKRTVSGKQSKIRLCYERGMLSDPNLAGRLDVKLEIASSGTVTSATGGTSSFPEPLRACVLGVFEGMKFPSSTRPTTVTYPIVFAKS